MNQQSISQTLPLTIMDYQWAKVRSINLHQSKIMQIKTSSWNALLTSRYFHQKGIPRFLLWKDRSSLERGIIWSRKLEALKVCNSNSHKWITKRKPLLSVLIVTSYQLIAIQQPRKDLLSSPIMIINIQRKVSRNMSSKQRKFLRLPRWSLALLHKCLVPTTD